MSQKSYLNLLFAIDKFQKTFYLLKASVEKTSDFDFSKTYTPD